MKCLLSSPFCLIPFKFILELWQLPFSIPLLFQISPLPPTSCQSSAFSLRLLFNIFVQTPDHRLYPTSLFFFIFLYFFFPLPFFPPLDHAAHSHLTKIQWKKTTPYFGSHICPAIYRSAERQTRRGCLGLHPAQWEASAPPPQMHLLKTPFQASCLWLTGTGWWGPLLCIIKQVPVPLLLSVLPLPHSFTLPSTCSSTSFHYIKAGKCLQR